MIDAKGVHAMQADDIPPDDWIEGIVDGQGPSVHEAQIYKVPKMLLANEGFANNYKPRMVSIGPYHYSNCELRHAAFKHKMTRKFAESIHRRDHPGQEIAIKPLIRGWYDAIEANIDEWRKCYEDGTTTEHSDQTLTRILLLDGCSTLHYIDKISQPPGDQHKYFLEHMQMKSHEVALVQRDMFLLENQLPYGVLKMLMGQKYTEEWKEKIKNFITIEIIKLPPLPNKLDKRSKQKTEDPAHLLDFLRKLLLNSPKKTRGRKRRTQECGGSVINELEERPIQQCADWRTFRIKDLTMVGIKLRRSSTRILGDISFRPWCMNGYLYLPPIVVDDSTAATFLNLIAYEMCLGGPNGVTSYICFLDSLIDHPDDVTQLREARILFNALGSDQDVADLFNKIGTDLVPNEELYFDVRNFIWNHCDNKFKVWVGKTINRHFRAPWTYSAVLAALFTLTFESLQTWYAFSEGPCDGLCTYLTP